MNNNKSRPERASSGAYRAQSGKSESAQRGYERYLDLARAEALSGNRVEAENYYQYAEHYFRVAALERAAPAGL